MPGNPDSTYYDCDDMADYYDATEGGCEQCGDDGADPFWWESACPDDLCHGGEVPCMHGDYARLPCNICGK